VRSKESLANPKLSLFVAVVAFVGPLGASTINAQQRKYNEMYRGPYLNRVAFPIGGIGAGMVCLEGTGAISHLSVRNTMQVFNEPCSFAALCIKGTKANVAKVLEGPVPAWKTFGSPGTGNGAARTSYGLPRFDRATFRARFPFGTVTLRDKEIPLQVRVTGWSPFIPGDPDNASEAVFSYNTKNFMEIDRQKDTILPIRNGFILHQEGTEENPENLGSFAFFVDDNSVVVDHCWFKGGWWDSLTLAWKNIQEARLLDNPPVKGRCPGASLFVPITLKPGGQKTVCLMFAWYVPPRHPKTANALVAATTSPGTPADSRISKTSHATGIVTTVIYAVKRPNSEAPSTIRRSPPRSLKPSPRI